MILPFVTLTIVWPASGSRSRPPHTAAGVARRSRPGRCPAGRTARPRRGSRAARCARLRARTPTRSAPGCRVELRFADAPRIDRERGMADHGASSSSARSRDDDVGAVRFQRGGLPDAIDPDHDRELPGSPGFDADERVLEHRRVLRFLADRACAGEVGVRRRLAPEILGARRYGRRRSPRTVRDPRRRQNVTAVGARRDDAAAKTSVASGLHVSNRAVVGLNAVLVDQLENDVVLTSPSPLIVNASGGSSGLPSGRSIPREARNARTPSARGLPSTYSS